MTKWSKTVGCKHQSQQLTGTKVQMGFPIRTPGAPTTQGSTMPRATPVINNGWGNPDASTGSWGDACDGCDAWGHTFKECPAQEAHSDLHTIAGLVFREHMAQAADHLHKAAAVAKAALQQWDAEVQIYRALIRAHDHLPEGEGIVGWPGMELPAFYPHTYYGPQGEGQD